MDDFRKKNQDLNEKDIVFSQTIKAGKRIYYLDVKRNRKEELYVAVTESKKVVTGENENGQVSFEKHKIFLYQDDFEKFADALQKVMDYVRQNQDPEILEKIKLHAEERAHYRRENETSDGLETEGDIKLDIDF